MNSVRGIGAMPEPAPERRVGNSLRKPDVAVSVGAQDDVRISPEAKRAAKVAGLKELVQAEPDVREDRVAAARASIERGDYKREDIVATVAERLSRYLPEE